MKRELSGRMAIKKLKDIQVELREIQRRCFLMSYNDMTTIISSIQDIKLVLDRQDPEPIFN